MKVVVLENPRFLSSVLRKLYGIKKEKREEG